VKKRLIIVLLVFLLIMTLVSCSKKKEKPNNNTISTSEALAGYWQAQTNLTQGLEARDGTMSQINQKIAALGTAKKNRKDSIAEIDALVNTYITQSNQAAALFDELIALENAIKPYGVQNKGIFSNICSGIYNKAKDTVVSSGRMVRSGWRVLSGRQTIRQVLNDPESGIPIVSNFAATIQKHNADRDQSIRQSILNNNGQDGMIPLDQLEGNTPQEKVNYYLNLPEESSLKMNIRRDVMYWDEAERTRTASTAKELGETGVKTVGDAYGGGAGEWTNEVLNQHLNQDQSPTDKGTVDLNINKDAANNPPVQEPKTIIISKANMPADDPRITVVMDAPQNLVQQLPTGEYNIIVLAQDYIRTTVEQLQITLNDTQTTMAKLLTLQGNAIVVQSVTPTPETVFMGETARVDVSCVSTIGQNLTFIWTITGGTYTNNVSTGASFTFKPTQEGTYTVNLRIEDSAGNFKERTVEIDVINTRIVAVFDSIIDEDINDDKLNPGEQAIISLNITNNGANPVSGLQSISGEGGITSTTSPSGTTISAGETETWQVNIKIPKLFSETNGSIIYKLDTFDQNNNPVTISVPITFPVEFYVEIDDIESPVLDRVLSISGTVANPLLSTAIMFIDSDYDTPVTLNLNNGNFYQNIAISGSATEVPHEIKVIAYSGSQEAEDIQSFTSHVPLTALRMTLTWDTPGTDVDFWCTDPNGEKCYYANQVTASGLELDFDDTNGYGPENITTTNIIPGDYLVQVHYYSDHDSENAIYSNCQVVIRQNEGQANETTNFYYGGLSDTGDIWTVTTLTFDGAKWSLKEANTHSQIQPKNLPPKKK